MVLTYLFASYLYIHRIYQPQEIGRSKLKAKIVKIQTENQIHVRDTSREGIRNHTIMFQNQYFYSLFGDIQKVR